MSYAGGLWACFSDFSICIYGTFCTCCLNGQNHAKIRTEECTPCHVLAGTHPFWIRKELEKKNGETGSDTVDCLLSTCCMSCAVCQDARDLKG